MALFLPTAAVDKVLDITPELIRAMKARAIILDVDNTLAVHGSQEPFEGTIEWTRTMRENGIDIIIMSNNFKRRVAPFAAKYGLPFMYLSLKPLPLAYHRAIRRMGVKHSEVVVVGDQVFTDVIGANLSFMKSILLVPTGKEQSISFAIRRFLETPIRYIVKATKRGKEYFE
ncbi:MAG: YqeG family HAD IIIA-type phosphatase [Clostridiales bacterium]|nr:YqeG family HAD IIIA-type phosphatase [Clostridiales bacterium]